MGVPETNERVTYGIAHQDEHMLVVRKRAGLVTEPGVGHERDTLLNGLMDEYGNRLRQLGEKRDFGLVHRLDKETSGLLLVALTPDAYDGLRAAFENRKVEKYYWAICNKAPREDSGVIRLNLDELVERSSRYTSTRTAKVVRGSGGKPALTAYRVVAASELGALIEARPVTGRLHQVRAHLSAIGASVLGDPVYGPKAARGASKRLALHAHRVKFEHPVTGEAMDIKVPLPPDLRRLLTRLDIERPEGS